MKSKKIMVFISTKFVPWGGITTAFMNYYRNMDCSDLVIDVAATGEGDPKLIEEIVENGGCYIALPDKRQHPFVYMYSYWKACKGYDVIHIHGNSATIAYELMAGRLRGVRARLAHIHSSNCVYHRLDKLMRPFFYHSYTKGITVSKKAAEWIFKNRECVILNNAIDCERYRYCNEKRKIVRRRLDIKDTAVVVGHVGKLVESKNHLFMLHVFSDFLRTNESARLLLVGGGALEPEIRDECARLKIAQKVIITGMVSDASDYYSAMDVFIFPSIYEGFGLAMVEAQANGLYCVASNRVPRETDATGRVKYLSLNESAELWSYVLKEAVAKRRKEDDSDLLQAITRAGYCAATQAKKLRELYTENM